MMLKRKECRGRWRRASRCSMRVAGGTVVETAGAGDAFNGGFAAALARGDRPEDAARFASALAGISVTRPGTAPSMPMLSEIEALLAQ